MSQIQPQSTPKPNIYSKNESPNSHKHAFSPLRNTHACPIQAYTDWETDIKSR